MYVGVDTEKVGNPHVIAVLVLPMSTATNIRREPQMIVLSDDYLLPSLRLD